MWPSSLVVLTSPWVVYVQNELTSKPRLLPHIIGARSSISQSSIQPTTTKPGFFADSITQIHDLGHSVVVVAIAYIQSVVNNAFIYRQLGHRGASKLVSLVQGLSHLINVFLEEYNKYNNLQLNLPGFRPYQKKHAADTTSSFESIASSVPEDILHQQRILMQTCDKLKLNVSRYMMLQTNGGTSPTLGAGAGGGGGGGLTEAPYGSSESAVVDVITQLGATFTKLIELMLSKEIKVPIYITVKIDEKISTTITWFDEIFSFFFFAVKC